jgi:hypothetical protein
MKNQTLLLQSALNWWNELPIQNLYGNHGWANLTMKYYGERGSCYDNTDEEILHIFVSEGCPNFIDAVITEKGVSKLYLTRYHRIKSKTVDGELAKQYFTLLHSKDGESVLVIRKLVLTSRLKDFMDFDILKAYNGKYLVEQVFSIKLSTIHHMLSCIANPTAIKLTDFIAGEIASIEAEREKYAEPYNHEKYMNTDRILDGAKLFLKWVGESELRVV